MRAGDLLTCTVPPVRAEQQVAAHGVLTTAEGAVALVRIPTGRPDAGRWQLPGGLVRHGEHPRETVRRTVAEALGVEVEAAGVRDAVADVTELPRRGISLHTVRLLYELRASSDWPAHLRDSPDVETVARDSLAGHGLTEFTTRALGVAPLRGGPIEHRPPIRPVDARRVEASPDGGPPKVQRVGAYALVPDGGRLLLTRYVGSGRWSLPGGGIDHGEQPQEALHREVREETGLTLRDVRLADVDSVHFTGHAPDGALEDFHAVRIVYRGTVRPDAEPAVLEVDGSSDAAAWIRLDELDRYPLTGFVGIALRLLP
jgi:ADP-ribose pyrophosphatase YjhB (NUDIX family)